MLSYVYSIFILQDTRYSISGKIQDIRFSKRPTMNYPAPAQPQTQIEYVENVDYNQHVAIKLAQMIDQSKDGAL